MKLPIIKISAIGLLLYLEDRKKVTTMKVQI
jgi:hypothetical protein